MGIFYLMRSSIYGMIMGERIFAVANLCNGILAVDNNLYMCLLV